MPTPAPEPNRIFPAMLAMLFASFLLGLAYYSASPAGLQGAQAAAPKFPAHRALKKSQTESNHAPEGPK